MATCGVHLDVDLLYLLFFMNLKMDMLHTVLHLPDVNCENVRQCNVLLWIQSHAEVKKKKQFWQHFNDTVTAVLKTNKEN